MLPDYVSRALRSLSFGKDDLTEGVNREILPVLLETRQRLNELIEHFVESGIDFPDPGILDFPPIAEPDPPPTGCRRLYVDEADGELKCMDAAGVVTVLT